MVNASEISRLAAIAEDAEAARVAAAIAATRISEAALRKYKAEAAARTPVKPAAELREIEERLRGGTAAGTPESKEEAKPPSKDEAVGLVAAAMMAKIAERLSPPPSPPSTPRPPTARRARAAAEALRATEAARKARGAEGPAPPPPPTPTPTPTTPGGGETAASLVKRGNAASAVALFCAARDGDAWRASSLLEARRVDVNCGVKDGKGRLAAPVHAAAERGHVDVLGALVGAGGCDLDVRDSNRNTAAHLAARHGHVAVLEVLLRGGAAYRGAHHGGKMLWTPAHEAAAAEQWAALDYLAGCGCPMARLLRAKKPSPESQRKVEHTK